MFKVSGGSTRLVIILFNRLVLKFPNCYGLYSQSACSDLKRVWKSDGFVAVWKDGLIRELLRRLIEDFFQGVFANVCEGFMWSFERSSFLHPTLSLVFCNVQSNAGDVIPTKEQIKLFFESIPKEAGRYFLSVDPHQYDLENWRIINGRLRLIDYGGSKLYDSSSFLYLLKNWKKEIEEGLSKPVA